MEKMTKERMRSLSPEEFRQIPEWPESDPRAQWYEEDETPGCIDSDGQRWKFIRDDAGTLHKQRRPRGAL